MNARIPITFVVALLLTMGCTRNTIYLKNEYTGFIGPLDTTTGSRCTFGKSEYRVVRPTKEELAAQDMLYSLKIPKVRFDNMTLPDVLKMLERIQKEANSGVALPIRFQEVAGEEYRVNKVSFGISDATLIEVLRVICAETHLTLGMKGQFAVLFYGSDFFPPVTFGTNEIEQ